MLDGGRILLLVALVVAVLIGIERGLVALERRERHRAWRAQRDAILEVERFFESFSDLFPAYFTWGDAAARKGATMVMHVHLFKQAGNEYRCLYDRCRERRELDGADPGVERIYSRPLRRFMVEVPK